MQHSPEKLAGRPHRRHDAAAGQGYVIAVAPFGRSWGRRAPKTAPRVGALCVRGVGPPSQAGFMFLLPAYSANPGRPPSRKGSRRRRGAFCVPATSAGKG